MEGVQNLNFACLKRSFERSVLISRQKKIELSILVSLENICDRTSKVVLI